MKLSNINKISIIGGSGTGKTTLANSLGLVLDLPVCHLDGLNYFSEWEERDKNERDKLILEKIKEKKWIIDGTYRSTLKQRLELSDLIIYLDYSTFTQVRGILGRYLKLSGKERNEIPGCKEKMDKEFFFWVLRWRKTRRNDILEIIKEIDPNKLLIFKSRRKLNKWYKKTFNNKIRGI